MHIQELSTYLNRHLEVDKIQDAALNGLQIEGCAEVTKVAVAVDFSLEAARFAAQNNCQVLLCHHGMYWPSIGAITGNTRERVKVMLDNDISLYASHLPLDIHPELGNNAVIASMLEAKIIAPFAVYHGQKIGFVCELNEELTLEDMQQKINALLDTESLLIKSEHGKDKIKIIGIVSGGAAKQIKDAAELGLDLFLTGEASHSEFHFVKENKTHMLCAGHYKTETTGIQALGKHLTEMFDLEVVFFDFPTGL